MVKVMPFPDTSSTDIPVPACKAVHQTASRWTFAPSSSYIPSKNVPMPHKTRIMATLNATPDSFSDGSTHNTIKTALAYTAASVSAGADIVDIGGCSTRPGASFVSAEEESARVIPIIEAIRASNEASARNVLISVDTFRASVAHSAIIAGANCINDVHAFTGTDYPLTHNSGKALRDMRIVAREHAVPVILMHSRGAADKNKDYGGFDSAIDAVAHELGEKVDAIVRGPRGVRRWLVLVDPGIGFSKTVSGNVELLRHASDLKSDTLTDGMLNPLRGLPQLVGASRKSFLGRILAESDHGNGHKGRDVEPKERDWATAAAIAAAVQQGVEVVRLHNVLELRDVVSVANRIWE
jgi:dihydroneopterin aldolase / 2-amino-4-hydroxy-6-hydroxymethyldihydropteridine diphosphokinase / dihydropteroate synthase